jgi:hypothetical protein
VAGSAPHHLNPKHGMDALTRGERGGRARETASSPSAARRRWVHVAETAGQGDAGTGGPAAAKDADAAEYAEVAEESAGYGGARDPLRRARAHRWHLWSGRCAMSPGDVVAQCERVV